MCLKVVFIYLQGLPGESIRGPPGPPGLPGIPAIGEYTGSGEGGVSNNERIDCLM